MWNYYIFGCTRTWCAIDFTLPCRERLPLLHTLVGRSRSRVSDWHVGIGNFPLNEQVPYSYYKENRRNFKLSNKHLTFASSSTIPLLRLRYGMPMWIRFVCRLIFAHIRESVRATFFFAMSNNYVNEEREKHTVGHTTLIRWVIWSQKVQSVKNQHKFLPRWVFRSHTAFVPVNRAPHDYAN